MTLDERSAFQAMRLFVGAYWERGGKTSEDIAILLGELNMELWADESPADPAMWTDWLAAVERATSIRP